MAVPVAFSVRALRARLASRHVHAQRVFGLHYWPVIAFEAVVETVLVVGLLRLLTALVGHRSVGSGLTAAYMVSPALLSNEFWCANALHTLPSLCATVWSVERFVTYLRSGDGRH